MEYAKDEIFNITYNEKLNRLEIKKKGIKSRLNNFFKNHVIFSITSIAFIIFSFIDLFLIYNFMIIFKGL